MIPWIQVYSNLPQHPKTTKLADELGLTSAALNPNVLAVGLLVSLWAWAIQNAHNGDLSGCSSRAIAEACLWKKKPETLVKALQSAGFLDKDMKLHDWEEYACLLMEQEENRRAKTRDRVKRYRDKKAAEAAGDGNVDGNAPCNVTDTPGNAPTIPDHTRQDLTRPDKYSSGGGDARAQARENMTDFLQGRDLDPGVFYGYTPEIQAEVAAITDAAFASFTDRRATGFDYAQAFQALHRSTQDPATLTWKIELPDNARDLLLYAFEAAAAAGNGGDWRYINGVLAKLGQRGIRTLRQAEDYDYDRNGGF